MKQPKIKIFGKVHKVLTIEFTKDGELNSISYLDGDSLSKVFKRTEMITESLTSTYKIQKPTRHPYHNYSYAPDLEKLLVV